MTMTFSFSDNYDEFAQPQPAEYESLTFGGSQKKPDKIHLFADKLCVPPLENYISRPRLDELFRNSLEKIGALLITGRAGTGKTALAAHFSRNYQKNAWYHVEAADNDWQVFSSYLYEVVKGKSLKKHDENVEQFTEKLFGGTIAEQKKQKTPRLIVLDGVHNIFDAEWFSRFFPTALHALPPAVHLIFLARSKPQFPLWRLRSKQVLAVIDEKMLACDRSEAEKICRTNGITNHQTEELLADSFGRIGKLKTLLKSKTDKIVN